MSEDKICPLKRIAYAVGDSEVFPACDKEYCAWWVSDDAKCAVLSLAEAIAYIAYDKPR